MEHTDWIRQGFDAGQARFLMVTAITHHRFSSPIWGEREVRKLHGELAEIEIEIEIAAARIVARRPAQRRLIWPSFRKASRWPSYARNSRRPLLNAWLGLP